MNKLIKSRIMQITIALTLVIGMVCGVSVPAMAKDNSQSNTGTDQGTQMSLIKGKVTGIADDGSSFEVTKNDDTTIDITVDENTKYYLVEAGPYTMGMKEEVQQRVEDLKNNIPNKSNQRGLGDNNEVDSALDNTELEQGLMENSNGPRGLINRVRSWFGGWHGFGEEAAFDDIELEDGVIVRVMPNEDLAKQVLIVKPSSIKKISGTIESVGDDSFTVSPESGDDVELTIDENTSVTLKGAIGLAEGQWASVVYKVESDTNLAITVRVQLEPPAVETTTTTTTTDDSTT